MYYEMHVWLEIYHLLIWLATAASIAANQTEGDKNKMGI